MSRKTTSIPTGVIEPGALYQIEEFKRRTGFGNHAMRTARRNGLKVRYLGGRAFVHADDFFAYINKLDADQQS
jgi:hypothetical protein